MSRAFFAVVTGQFHSPASLSHTACLSDTGISTESTPSRLTPRKMNGNTVASSFGPATKPQQATEPPGRICFSSSTSGVPPTVSTALANTGLSRGFLEASKASLPMISEAPSSFSRSGFLPETATTSNPRRDKISTATLPTLPLAPVTTTLPWCGEAPILRSFCTQSPAVKPAVPYTMAWRGSSFHCDGTAAHHSRGTRIYSPKPPSVFIPRSYPVTITKSPASLTPTASIPGVCGYCFVTPLFPTADKASL
mmetsp:Transcript_771/g.1437  ORF Transcript_771/g.1437 Transcript_771/m.1437 type:complete len:252 (-) Transcript_771:307-1062(-)